MQIPWRNRFVLALFGVDEINLTGPDGQVVHSEKVMPFITAMRCHFVKSFLREWYRYTQFPTDRFVMFVIAYSLLMFFAHLVARGSDTMPQELFDSGVSRATSDEMGRIFADASNRL